MIYRLALGTANDAPIVEHDAPPGSIHISDEISVDGVMWLVYELARFDHPGNADFVCALSAPAVVMSLGTANVEIYGTDLARIRPEVARLVYTRGQPATDLLDHITGILVERELPRKLSDESLAVLSHAIHAIEVSDAGLSDRMRALWHELRDYLNRHA